MTSQTTCLQQQNKTIVLVITEALKSLITKYLLASSLQTNITFEGKTQNHSNRGITLQTSTKRETKAQNAFFKNQNKADIELAGSGQMRVRINFI